MTAALGALLAAFQYALVAVAASYERSGSFGVPVSAGAGLRERPHRRGADVVCRDDDDRLFRADDRHARRAIRDLRRAEPAAEIEGGLVDTIAARPLPRHWLVTRTLVVMAIGTVALMIAMGTATSLASGSWRRRAPAGPRRASCCS